MVFCVVVDTWVSGFVISNLHVLVFIFMRARCGTDTAEIKPNRSNNTNEESTPSST